MIPAAFAYDRPATLDEAIGLLAGDDVKILAGGQSLLPLLKLRVASASRLVDIGRIRELHGVRPTPDGGIAIGAMTTYREFEDSSAASRYGCLAEAIPQIGDLQVRNRGTIGGSAAHADPSSDIPAVLLALDATFVARSKSGDRRIPATSFFSGGFETVLADGELLTEILIGPAPAGSASVYRKLGQRASGYSIVGVAAVIGRAGGRIDTARIGVTGVGDVAYRASAVESALIGSDGSAAAIAAAAAHAADGQTVAGDIHADRAYRAQMAIVYVRRAIEGALEALG
jgi:aerobic carbon-monoxide dehydrogenase medium subunit